MSDKAVDIVVDGRVQGVGFRYSCLVEANRLGVRGWVRNNESQGTVTGHFEGAARAVDELVVWCRSGPRGARVEHVDVDLAPLEGAQRFLVAG